MSNIVHIKDDRKGHPYEKIKRARPCGLALLHTVFAVYLSAATGNRAPETVIKVKAKPTGRLKHWALFYACQ
jgi:hypothetical protein